MIQVEIGKNDGEQRLDRFLKKYLPKASLSRIYKIIRKDLKVNNRRGKESTKLMEGDVLSFYIDEKIFESLTEKRKIKKVRKNFRVVYEDEKMLIASKPFGLLTHGDRHEKKNHLANQVIAYLTDKGEYVPSKERTFVPSPVNRLDRNTTGLIIFGKNANSLKELNKMIKEREKIGKFYLTVVAGVLKEEVELKGSLSKDENKNKVKVSFDDKEEKYIQTRAMPLASKKGYTLVEVELVTGRTHQIRAHLAAKGYPIVGDVKYGNKNINDQMRRRYNLTTQLLHAYKLNIGEISVMDELPGAFRKITEDIFGDAVLENIVGK